MFGLKTNISPFGLVLEPTSIRFIIAIASTQAARTSCPSCLLFYRLSLNINISRTQAHSSCPSCRLFYRLGLNVTISSTQARVSCPSCCLFSGSNSHWFETSALLHYGPPPSRCPFGLFFGSHTAYCSFH
jgi:hypothetical protein